MLKVIPANACLTLFLLFGLSGCGVSSSADSTPPRRLIITGSSTVAPLAAEIALRFEEQNPGVRIDVQSGGSSRGIADAKSGVADIGMASRPLADDEQELFSHQIATDGICMIVHRDNPLSSLSDEQVKSIYLNEVNNWKEFGWKDAEIVVAHKADGRATLDVFLKYFQLKNVDVKADIIVGDNQQGIKTVTGNPNAIAYVSIGTARYEAELGSPLKLLNAGKFAPTPSAVASGEFPMTRPLNFVTKAEPTGLAKQFIDFAMSSNVHDLVEQQSFVPIQN